MKRDYGGVIWTDHALQRLQERGISQGDAWATFNSPEQSRLGSNKMGSSVYYRTYPSRGGQGLERIEVVAKKNQEGRWIIMSVWSKPIYQGSAKSFQRHSQTRKADPPLIWFIKWIFNKHK